MCPDKIPGPKWAFSAESAWGPAADVAIVRDAEDNEKPISTFVSNQSADVHCVAFLNRL